MRTTTFLAAAGLLAMAAPASAHHSTAMFDSGKTVTLTGTVKEFKMLNPHSWLMLAAPGPDGAMATWRIETSGPYALSKIGLKTGAVPAGAQATVTINPMKNGTAEGNLKTLSVGGKEFRIGGGG